MPYMYTKMNCSFVKLSTCVKKDANVGMIRNYNPFPPTAFPEVIFSLYNTKYRAHDTLKTLFNPRIDLERIVTVRPTQVTNHVLIDCAKCSR